MCARSCNGRRRNSNSTTSTECSRVAAWPAASASSAARTGSPPGRARRAPGRTPPRLSGRVSVGLDVEGTGRSPVAVIGALKGAGTFTVQDGRAQRLDPAAFDAVIRVIDQGLPIDTARIRERMEQALGAGTLSIPLAEGEITVAAGQGRVINTVVRAQGADLAIGGNAVLTDETVDAKLTLSGAARPDG